MDSLELNALPTHPTLLHPRTGDPLRAVGILPNGRVVWPIMGGDGSEADANDGAGDGNGEGEGDPGNEGGNDLGDEGEGEGEGDENDSRVARANRQAANYRGQLREAQQTIDTLTAAQTEQGNVLQALRAALTGETGEGDGEGDPAEQVATLTSEAESLRTEVSTLRAELLVHDLAPDNGGNARALLDSRGFLNTLQGLDPEGENYRTEVADAIKAAVAGNAAYRAGLGSSRGGSELDGERRERQQQRPKTLGAAIGAAMGGK